MEDTKVRIMVAAEELIAERGVSETSIADIARKAGVTAPLVHKYFGTKQNLLFTFVSSRMEEATEELREQLEGIHDPESRLRKLIWYSLRYNDNHPAYTRTLMPDVRSNRVFYKSVVFKAIRTHYRITRNILNQGVKDGIFRSDIDIRMILDIIYGVLDFEAISCFIVHETEKNVNSFEEIVQILLRIILNRGKSNEAAKEKIILKAAEEVIAEYGFSKAKISEVARRAKLAEGTIYEYFKSKEDILFSIPIRPFQDYLSRFQEAFNVKSPSKKLQMLLKLHFDLYLSNRNFLAVFVFDLQSNAKFYNSPSYEAFRQYGATIEQVIEEGKADGSFCTDVNARIFRNMFFGAFTHMAIRWLIMQQNRNYDKMLEINNLVNLFLECLLRNN